MIDDRLFVPLETRHYRNFVVGSKEFELRGVNAKFNEETVYEGRLVELRHGYAGDSLWGQIEAVDVVDDLESILDHELILPGATREEFLESARDLLGSYDRWIAFEVELVFWACQNGGRSKGKLHRVPDCVKLAKVDESDLLYRPRHVFDPDQSTCSSCGGASA